MFDSSMVNEPSGFEPLKFYCITIMMKQSKGLNDDLKPEHKKNKTDRTTIGPTTDID